MHTHLSLTIFKCAHHACLSLTFTPINKPESSGANASPMMSAHFYTLECVCPVQRKKGQEKKWPMMAELGGKKEAPLTAEKGASYR